MKQIYVSEKENKLRAVYKTSDPVYTKEDLLSRPDLFRDTEIIFSTWGMPSLSEEEIQSCLPSLKAVFYGAGTVQKFARPFLRCGVRIFSAWAANAVPVAEYTVAQIVLANKGFFQTMRYEDRKAAKALHAHFPGNYGGKVGLIGAGMIGKMVISRLKDYALQVLVFDPFLPDERAAFLK